MFIHRLQFGIGANVERLTDALRRLLLQRHLPISSEKQCLPTCGHGHRRFQAFDRRPFLFISISFLAGVALVVILLRYTGPSLFWTVVWFSLVSVLTLLVFHTARDPEKVRSIQWERFFLTFVPLIFGLYAFEVYPNLRHEFGGGAPVPIVLHLTKKLPVFDSESVPVSLIDETEQGYYVLRGSDKAVFVARGLVEEVEFLRSAQTTQPNPVKP
jgi:hypothetical protein